MFTELCTCKLEQNSSVTLVRIYEVLKTGRGLRWKALSFPHVRSLFPPLSFQYQHTDKLWRGCFRFLGTTWNPAGNSHSELVPEAPAVSVFRGMVDTCEIHPLLAENMTTFCPPGNLPHRRTLAFTWLALWESVLNVALIAGNKDNLILPYASAAC